MSQIWDSPQGWLFVGILSLLWLYLAAKLVMKAILKAKKEED